MPGNRQSSSFTSLDDQDETDDLDQERDLLASLIQKLKCEIDDSKNRNKFLESSNKELVDKLKGEIEDFKTKNKSLESSNNHFKEANNELSKTNQLMFKDLKKFQAELNKYNYVNYASKVEIGYAKAKGDLMSYKIDFEKSSNAYTQKINDLNQTISDMRQYVPQVAETVTTSNELELLYSLMFSELLNINSPVVSKSYAVHAVDNPDKRQQHNTTDTSTTTDVADPPPLNIHSTHQTPTQIPTVSAHENIIQAETNTKNA
ncbi:hypothetical protein Tco_1197666 [Tanacetum coccineum]